MTQTVFLLLLALLVFPLSACSRANRDAAADSTATIAALRDTLTRLFAEDQRGRDSIPLAVQRNDSVFMVRLMREDSARTRQLQAIIAKHGWPRKSIVGDSAAEAAWLILQHSPMIEFQEQMLPVLEKEAARGEVSAREIAMLSDRLLVHRGKPQRYGSSFSMKNGKLVADPIANMAIVDSLRASVAMPTMAEYVKVLGEIYHMPVEWPPARK